MENFEYGQAGSTVYDFLWSEFADWYIEYAKVVFAGDNEADKARTRAILVHVFDMVLRLLHPFVPFVTEAMWGYLPKLPTAPKALIVAKWPEPGPDPFEDSLVDFKLIQEIVRSIRNLRAEKGVVPSKRIAASFAAGAKADLLKEQSKAIASLAGLNEAELNIAESLSEKPDDASVLVVGSIEIYLPLAGMVDLAEEKTRLEKELKEAESHIERLEKLLGSDFANKAPAAVVQKEQEKLAGYKETAEKLKAQLK
jgi:valyl-tRNA synthetase